MFSLDANYIKYGLVEIDKNGNGSLTAKGACYGTIVIISIETVNKNEPAPLEVYESFDPQKLPEGLIEFNSLGFELTTDGVDFALDYMTKHSFIKRIYICSQLMFKDTEIIKVKE